MVYTSWCILEFKKKSTFDKVEEIEEDLTELSDEIKYLSQELEEEKLKILEELEEELEEEEEEEEEEDDDEEEDAELSPAEWATKFERDVAKWDQEEDDHYNEENGVHSTVRSDVEDDRLYVEMPGYDASLNFAESQIGVDEDEEAPDPFQHWDQGMA